MVTQLDELGRIELAKGKVSGMSKFSFKIPIEKAVDYNNKRFNNVQQPTAGAQKSIKTGISKQTKIGTAIASGKIAND